MQLLNNIKLTKVSNGATAGQTAVDSNIIDMSGFDGVIFIADLATVTDACVLTLVAQQNTLNQTGGMASITGATTGAQTAATSSNMGLAVDVYRPLQRYLRAELTRTAQNATVNSIWAIQYIATKKPTTQDATTILKAVASVGA